MTTKKTGKENTKEVAVSEPKKKRAIREKTAPEVGIKRYFLYKNTIEHVHKSINDGFYLEAITLIESMISDRLESRLGIKAESSKYDFKPLGDLLAGIRKHETEIELLDLCALRSGKLYVWKNARNKYLHAMAKLEENDPNPDWKKRKEKSKEIAEEGFELFKEVRDLVSKYKRKETKTVAKKKKPPMKTSVRVKTVGKK